MTLKNAKLVRKAEETMLDELGQTGIYDKKHLRSCDEHISKPFPRAMNICFSRFQVYATTNST